MIKISRRADYIDECIKYVSGTYKDTLFQKLIVECVSEASNLLKNMRNYNTSDGFIKMKTKEMVAKISDCLIDLKSDFKKLSLNVVKELLCALSYNNELYSDSEWPGTRDFDPSEEIVNNFVKIKELTSSLANSKYCDVSEIPDFAIFHPSLPVFYHAELVRLLKEGKSQNLDEIAEVAILDLPKGYTPIKKLGRGGSGDVYLVENAADKSKEALKILTLEGNTDDVMRAIESELQVKKLNSLRCKYIPTYYVFPHKGKFIISMEPYEKTLDERLDEAGGKLPLPEVMKYYEQLCNALINCLTNNIVHKDLAPHNIGIDSEGNIKLSDFGDPLTTIDKRLKQPPLDYSSPRLLALPEGSLEVLPADNVWSLGVILYEMLTGQKPFSSKDIERSDRKSRKEYIQSKQNESLKDDFQTLLSQIKISEDDCEKWFENYNKSIWDFLHTLDIYFRENRNHENHTDLNIQMISKKSKAEIIKNALNDEFYALFIEKRVYSEKRFMQEIVRNLDKYRSETGIPKENK